MKILITGHLGFIGSHLSEIIEADGFDIKAGQDIRKELPDKNYTHIFHLAAKRSVPLGEKIPEEFISTNCWGTVNILKKYPNARIINISSSTAGHVQSIYGATKAFAEKVGDFHSNCLSVRLYNVFGERQPLSSGAIIPRILYWKMNGIKPRIFGDGNQTRDFTYVKDVCYELKRLMFDTERTGLGHVGYSQSITVNELLDRMYGKFPDVEYLPKRAFEVERSSCPVEMEVVHYGRDEGLIRVDRFANSEEGALYNIKDSDF